ncbi:MAG: porin family protein [Cyclobacteriaceae bacterium]
MKKLIVGFLVSFSLTSALAQDTDCLQTLARANDEFTAGRFFGIPSLLKNCLDNGFTNEQKVQAYQLLTQAYLILDDPIAAEDSYLKLLKADPEFVASPDKDPIDIVYLSKKFTATPIFTPHFRVGTNVSLVRTIYEVSTEGYPVDRKNNIRPGFSAGVGLDWNINDNISIAGELDFGSKSFKITRNAISNDDFQESIERQLWLDVPFYVKYRDNLGKIRPFGYVGFAFNLLFTSNVELRTENRSPLLSETGSQVPTEGPNVKIGYKRNLFNRSLLAGGGAYYKIGKDFLFADVRYMAGMTNLADETESYYNEDGTLATTIGRYRWVGDYFRLDNLSFSIGYVKPLYNPRKIKKANTRKVLREINKGDN